MPTSTKSYEELERRVALIERKLTRARAKAMSLGAALAAAFCVALVGSLAPRASAQAQPPPQPRIVTRLEAPLLVVDEKGQSIVEISNAPGRYGLTVWGRAGGNTFIGTSAATGGGLIQLHEPKDKLTTQVGAGGVQINEGGSFIVKNKQGVMVGGLGVNAQNEGYLSLGNPTGATTVEAGTTNDNRGFVVAHPTHGPPPQVIPRWLMGGKGGGGAQ